MTISHHSVTGKTTIKLSWLETRQFISIPPYLTTPALIRDIQDHIKGLVKKTAKN